MRKGQLCLGLIALGAVSVAAHSVEAAPCSVPNAIANGQVADAAQIMANFNALNSCINTAPAGPTNSVQYNAGDGAFGGAGPLTNGQIAIGTTGGAPQPANLTAGAGITITNGAGAIAIATTGAAAPGLYDISVGMPTSYTGVNIGGSSSIDANGSRAVTVLIGNSPPTSATLYGFTVPAPTTTPYMAAILALPNFPPTKYLGMVVGYQDSTTGKLVTLGSFGGSAFGFAPYSFETWSDPNTRVTVSEPSVPRSTTFGPTWFGVEDDGTTISFWLSQDGAHFYPLGFTQAKAGGYLANYDRIFMGVFVSAEGGSDGSANANASVTYLAYDPNGLSRKAGP